MTKQLYEQAVKAVIACPEHRNLHGDEFHAYVRTIVREAQAKQSAPIRLLPPRITEHLRK